MNNEQHDDLAKSITGGTLIAVLFTIAILIAYAIIDRGM